MAMLLELGPGPELADGPACFGPTACRDPVLWCRGDEIEKCGWFGGGSFRSLGRRLGCGRSRLVFFPGVVIALSVAGEREAEAAHLAVRTSPDDAQGSEEASDLERSGQCLGGPQTTDSSL